MKLLLKILNAIKSINRYRKKFRLLVKQKGSIGKAYQYLRRYKREFGWKATKQFLRHLSDSQTQQFNAWAFNPAFQPKISVIVPNYNHVAFLPERLDSIFNQDYDAQKLEWIILDDQSSDNSVEVIRQYFEGKNIDYQLIINEKNAGNVFKQWKKGIEHATGELIWIAESDDGCAPDFLRNLVPVFQDKAVNIAFGAIQFMDAQGKMFDGLDAYRESAEPNIWQDVCLRPAAQWFNGAFGVNNVFANASGGLLRRQAIADEVWEKACEFKICGDWYVYLKWAGAGKIAYMPKAVSYFRQHQKNTSASNFNQLYYYREHFHILNEIQQQWTIRENIRQRFVEKVKAQYQHFQMEQEYGAFETQFAPELGVLPEKKSLHIQIYFLGFHVGGGELFPIVLANQLKDLGYLVSMVALDLDNINQDMAQRLQLGIPVYRLADLLVQPNFLAEMGVDVVHTHIIGADRILCEYLNEQNLTIPYIVTMHGSHQKKFLKDHGEDIVQKISAHVDKWVYIADKNLDFFDNHYFHKNHLVKLPNAMPIDQRMPQSSRESLGIEASDVVFAFAARGIFEKGWLQLVQAFILAQQQLPNQKLHLVLMGEGDAQVAAMDIAKPYDNIHFLGYESAVNGVFRYADCVVLPSRFEGESYPLCLIQAIQEHLPCIATEIGEVKSMIQNPSGQLAGILLPNEMNDELFIQSLTNALVQMSDESVRKQYQAVTDDMADNYDMAKLAQRYVELYQSVLK